jgi:oligogalacturonide transporter
MTTNYIDRTKLSSARMFISASGTFFVTMLPTIFLNIFGEDKPTGYTVTAIVFGIICAIIITVSNVMTWELTPEEAAMRAKSDDGEVAGEKETISSHLASYCSTFKNKSFRKHIAIYLCSFTGKDVFATSLLFYVVSVLGLKQADGQAALSLSFIAIFVTVGAGFIMAYKGPKLLYTISYSIILAVLAGFFLLSKFELGSHAGTITMLFILGGLYQIGRGILEFTPWNVFPFIPDIDKMITSKSRAGIYAAVMTFLRKSTGAVSTMLVAWILDMGGYDASADVQSIGAQSTITYVFVFGSGALILTALIVSRTFHLNAKTHAVVAAEINRLESGGSKADVTEDTRKVVEDLTGHPYSKLWGAG